MMIGLSGKAGSGKSVVARYLNDNGYSTRKFAGPLKAMLGALLEQQGVPPEAITDYTEGHLKEIPTEYLGGRSPRYAMQTLGTEWGRGLIADNFWVDAAMRQGSEGNLIFDDVRFPNEAAAIRRAGGIVVNVVRPALDSVDIISHPSEDAMSYFAFNYVIYNDSTVERLHQRIEAMLLWFEQYEGGFL